MQAFDTERWLRDAGRQNAWGYNTLGFFAPHAAHASAPARQQGADAVLREFKGMVRLLHEAGIQVVLDVVYNHTAEEGLGGPTTSLRGIDGANRYRWAHSASPYRDRYYDTTGCGNTLDTSVEATADLIVDSLVYWAREVQVDGFRFDLMAALARDGEHRFDPSHPLLERIRNHPDLQDTLVVAEPWDVGPDGWKTRAFGAAGDRTSEWNDGFRNTVRQFWLTDIAEERRTGLPQTGIGRLAEALSGSRSVFGADRGPLASVNFVTAHDGFTLLDLVSYDGKHNEANGEDNRDGSNDNPLVQPRHRGRHRRPGGPRRAWPVDAQPGGDAHAVRRGADAHRRRRAEPHPARQQQRLRGVRRPDPGRLVRRRGRRDDDRGRRRAGPVPAGAPVTPAHPLRRRGPGDARGLADVLVRTGRARDDDRGLGPAGAPRPAVLRRVDTGARALRPRPGGRARQRPYPRPDPAGARGRPRVPPGLVEREAPRPRAPPSRRAGLHRLRPRHPPVRGGVARAGGCGRAQRPTGGREARGGPATGLASGPPQGPRRARPLHSGRNPGNAEPPAG
ncbi:alpha-amylase family glycosyl hydrolase [Curtobacterium flaccumfaciens]|nr:alpha-amylase family glycosyl hydrolase [Curtobacterium flaccumfaciens]